MSSINSITADKLARLVGTPKSPTLIDVRTDEDFAADPRVVPASVRRSFATVNDWATDTHGRSAVVICHKGLKLSHGAAALLRVRGVPADVLEGGFVAWEQSGLPLIPSRMIPPRAPNGRTLWVTRERPKIDRIACPWLIRRFVDPTADFLFVAPATVIEVGEKFGATPFDIEGVFWSHRGEYCTFDVDDRGIRPHDAGAAAPGGDRARRRYLPPRSCA